MKKTFISHATEDHATAERICARLESEGLPCWMAPRDILEGEQWPDAIMRGLDECRVLVLIFSGHSNGSTWVIRELEKAASMSKTVIPVRLEDVQPSQRISFFVGLEQWLDASRPPIEPHIERLINAVRRHHGAAAGGGEPPVAATTAARPIAAGRGKGLLAVVAVTLIAVAALGWMSVQRGWFQPSRDAEVERYIEMQMEARGLHQRLAAVARTSENQRILDRADLAWNKAEAFHERRMTRQALAQYEAVVEAGVEFDALASARPGPPPSRNAGPASPVDKPSAPLGSAPRTDPPAAAGNGAGTPAPIVKPAPAPVKPAPPPLKLGQTEANSLGMPMVYISSGGFTMGSPEREWTVVKDERQVRVTLTKDFWMSATEVTRGQFAQFVAARKHKTTAEVEGVAWVSKDGVDNIKQPGLTWQAPGFNQNDTHPVVCVSWRDAVAFCEWLSAKEGVRYRLPSEAEWEFACRAGTTSPFVTGAYISTDDANYNGQAPNFRNVQGTSRNASTPVRSFEPNAWGLYDMHGNVWEWCTDYYAPTYEGGADPKGPPQGEFRVRRGGSFVSTMELLRSAFRSKGREDRAYPIAGFRVVREMR